MPRSSYLARVNTPGLGHEVKGSAFVTLRKWIADEHGTAMLERLLSSIPSDAKRALSDPLPSQWYPERVHADALRALFDGIARGDLDAFERIIGQCTALGVHTFANLVLTMSSPSFVLKRTPTLYGLIRRGPSTLDVDLKEHTAHLHYRGLPFFDDPLYRHYFRALLRALLTPSMKREPGVTLEAHAADSLDVRVDW